MPLTERVDAPSSSSNRSNSRSIVIAVGAVVMCWMLLMPPGSGPDEPGHVVRSGAVIRGELADRASYELPDRYQTAEPGCYAFQPTVAASCSTVPTHTGATLSLPTKAGEYPVWGHAVFGALTVLPGLDPVWWARTGGAVVAIALVGAAIARSARDRPPIAAGLLLGLTPMAWSTFGTVNPSSISIAGAVALWAGLMIVPTTTGVDRAGAVDRAGMLTALGWAALVLPRRDGLVWACITLAVVLAATDRGLVPWWRSLGRIPQALIATATLVTMVWGGLSDSRSTRFVVITPLIVMAAEAFRWWWSRPSHTAGTRVIGTVAGAFLAIAATFAVIDTRPGGWNTDLAIDVAMQTDDNLVEAIGVLGWLDAAVPAGAVYLWLVAVGMLAAAAATARHGRRIIGWALALAAGAIATSWVLELVQGNNSGTYWQGRYSLPLIVGVPLVLTWRPGDVEGPTSSADAAIGRAVGAIALVVLNIAAWSAARRFGVGTAGSLLPWRWDTPIQPVPPVLLLAVHAMATSWLAALLWWPRTVAMRNHG